MKTKINALAGHRVTGYAQIKKLVLAISSTVLLSGVFSSCVDDEFAIHGVQSEITRSQLKATNPGGLIQQGDGTWMTQNCRVPIVGPGKVITSIGGGLLDVAGGGNKVGNAIDTDLSNYTTTYITIASADVYYPIISIRDLYQTYSAGQKVGFVFKEFGSTVLNLNVLNGMTIQTFLNDNNQETVIAKGNTEGVLNLDLLSITSNNNIADREISFEATKPFDEVRLCMYGVGADVITTMTTAIKYAFVGQNPEIRATSESDFSSYWTKGNPEINNTNIGNIIPDHMTNVDDAENIINDNPTDSTPFTSQFGIQSKATVNFKRSIPVGTEIGFHYSVGEVLSISILGGNSPTLTSFDSSNGEVEQTTPGSELLGIGLLKGSKDAYISMLTKEECTQIQFKHPIKLFDIGGMNVYYAYVREPVKLDPTNYFAISSKDETYSTTYKLKIPAEGSVQYMLIDDYPSNTRPYINQGTLYGMTKPGPYKVSALYTDINGKQVVNTITIIKKDPIYTGNCNTYLTKDGEHDARIVEEYGPQGSISIISGTVNKDNIIDDNNDNYATFIGVLSLFEFRPLAAIGFNTITAGANGVRVGFEVQATTGLLDLTAIGTYQVKVYNNGEEVANSAAEGHVLNVGVLNFDNTRVRLSVNIEAGKAFDHIELWRKGVAGVLEAQKIYNVFFENLDCTEELPCLQVMTNNGHNLNVDYNKTDPKHLVNLLGGGFKNLDNLLDNSLDTYASLSGIDIISETKLELTFDKQPAKQPIGVVLSKEEFQLIDVDVLQNITISLFNGETEVFKIGAGGIANINIISRNKKNYIEFNPEDIKEEYDRIQLDFTKLVGVNINDINIHGLYTYTDCSVDDGNGNLVLKGGIVHVCEGEAISFDVESSTLEEDTQLNLDLYNRETGIQESTTGTFAGGTISIEGAYKLSAGRYYVDIKLEDLVLWNHAELYIHPTETKWKTNNSSTDWNNWDNWDNGSPWECTNVILPSDAFIYPTLKDEEKNMCNFIYFEPGAELVNTPAFSDNYPEKVFIDANLEGGKYSLFSAPLNGMVTGDMFVSNTNPGKFVSLNESTYPEQRFSPIIYQRFWSKTVNMVDVTPDVNIDQTDWSRTFNAINTGYEPAQGFSIRPGKDDETGNYTFCFPKEHETYNYFYTNGVATGQSIHPERSSYVGKFIMDKYGSIDLSIETSGTRFLLGNPFMTHLDIKEFLSENSTNVSSVEIYDGERYVPITIGVNGVLISTLEQTPTSVAPMGAIFVQAKTAGTSLTVNLTRDMFQQKAGSTPDAFRSRSVSSRSSVPNGMLRINATVNSKTSSCVVLQSQSASDSYSSKEDISILIDNEVKPEVAVYTVAERKALAIQRIKSGKSIPLGLYMKQSGSVKLDFDNGSNFWEGWMLFDSKTGKKHSLRESIVFSNISSVSNRFYLIKE
ncbi:hypothetical protein [Bacteroides caecigallinarum]|uniref:hypothetical protein n=2 Tax=Bacteroides TaxID=816 RepID=UPI001F15C6A7|nr:hypothetical protein [Bacteroides caecigallinarum]MCF2736350.1 hypothetical protein [Bacteroides caecigallinarum]